MSRSTVLWQTGVAVVVWTEAQERMVWTTSDPDQREHAKEVQKSEVHRYELSDSTRHFLFEFFIRDAPSKLTGCVSYLWSVCFQRTETISRDINELKSPLIMIGAFILLISYICHSLLNFLNFYNCNDFLWELKKDLTKEVRKGQNFFLISVKETQYFPVFFAGDAINCFTFLKQVS